ncbi:MAG TPA: DNA (cytosine-5-)-methyltransferase [Planctomycetaceae bacterium]|nr:DNA (cytosine-5-)-methyltransferase [Planctomycetaceae bacterium]|tara:strand:+ start:1641 stop:2897 length:1257 start_codon:yes stop_codon:yes gene_type:complete
MFVDLFSGCGGLSLGMLQAGWGGLFAIEKTDDAFLTLESNLLSESKLNRPDKIRFNWPDWLPKSAYSVEDFLNKYGKQLKAERDKIDLVVGGPPCQGYSSAGRRIASDPRNSLFKQYIKFVGIANPALILVENVKGMSSKFHSNGKGKHEPPHSELLAQALKKNGYSIVQQSLIQSSKFGVPQNRLRYITFAARSDLPLNGIDFFHLLEESRSKFLEDLGLGNTPVTVKQAISDLCIENQKLQPCLDPESVSGFQELVYKKPKTAYQKLMHGKMNGGQINSLRLPQHRSETIEKFKAILESCNRGEQVRGTQLNAKVKEKLSIGKRTTIPLSKDAPAPTITTLPDDMIHYNEARIHTVREHARMQSFPDWFEFRGTYTTGGKRRRIQCPRYTQVGNAVPPLLAKAMGHVLLDIIKRLK